MQKKSLIVSSRQPMKNLLILLFALFSCLSNAQQHSQELIHTPDLNNHLAALQGDYFKMKSHHVGREFHINVRLPLDYQSDNKKIYPVVYVLDGDSLFPLLAPTHLFLHLDEKLPEAIIVGITYGGFDKSINKRHIDFSASAIDAEPGEDGAGHFLKFLKNELLPTVENKFRTNTAKRVLIGQSRAGYFVLWSALEDPDLFWGRIASNPALTPGRARFFEKAASHSRKDLKVAIASGTRDTMQRQKNALDWSGAWSLRLDAPWQVNLIKLEGGTHAATIGESYRLGMLWLFQNEIDLTKTP
jgi:predicted alpha/beta superfamily hydrolase